MSPTDRTEFDKQITVMMGGFPGYFLTDERKESYWRGLQKMQMSSLIRVVDFVLSEEGPEKIPSVSAMWTTYRSLKTVRADAREAGQTNENLSRQQHLIALRRTAITCAKRETMPTFQDKVIWWECLPAHRQEKNKAEWEKWEKEFGSKTDGFFLDRAFALMKQWGEKKLLDRDFDHMAMG